MARGALFAPVSPAKPLADCALAAVASAPIAVSGRVRSCLGRLWSRKEPGRICAQPESCTQRTTSAGLGSLHGSVPA
jgi:hypothetical protein